VQVKVVLGWLGELLFLRELGGRLEMVFLRRFLVEAKKIELSVGEGASVLRLEERRKGLSNVAFLGLLCIGWLSSTVEDLLCDSGSKDFTKREGSRVSIAQRCSNSYGRFLEVAVYTGGGQRGHIMILEGREGGMESLSRRVE
jgi:hypothetical protein